MVALPGHRHEQVVGAVERDGQPQGLPLQVQGACSGAVRIGQVWFADGGRSRRVGGGEWGSFDEAELFGEADALDFAGGAFGDFVEDHDPAGGFEIGEALADEAADFALFGGLAVAQDDGCGDLFAESVVGASRR